MIAPGAKTELLPKYEGLNPTGSFKDRGMTVAISQAQFEGAEAVICASSGNTAASAAAYAARGGIRCIVLVPQGRIALGKLAAATAHGAEVISIDGSFDKGLEIVRQIAEVRPLALVNSINPWRLEGQITAAFEIVDQLQGRAPDWHCLPVGNAGNISAYWRGYKQYGRGLPRILGAQAAGAAPLVSGKPVDSPETLATAIRIGKPAHWREAVSALDESDGIVVAVSDSQIMASWKLLAQEEGIFVEPASAAGLASLQQEITKGNINPAGQIIVVVLTGHGLKDTETAINYAPNPIQIPAEIDAFESYLDG